MMNDWFIPVAYLASLEGEYADTLARLVTSHQPLASGINPPQTQERETS